ncbi:MAG TPA: hypothetical protein PKK06_14010 [Phycisphaerae bacterium]|nr:hypothetical protein [Phycisphaerae bacterium]HNU46404.1 hypothetical protein [Phycisphaerae bacterium]
MWRVGLFLGVGAVSSLFLTGEARSVDCYVTIYSSQKCGTDVEVSWVTCPPGVGSQKCVTEQWIYGYVSSCQQALAGVTECDLCYCMRTVIKRKCRPTEGGYECILEETPGRDAVSPATCASTPGVECNQAPGA